MRSESPVHPAIVQGPLNLTVEEGANARLSCRVRSEQVPAIKWMRRLGAPPEVADRFRPEELLTVGDEQYRLILNSRYGILIVVVFVLLWHIQGDKNS